MFTDLLIVLAWVAIVFLPVIVASRGAFESHNGYVDNSMKATSQDSPAPEEAAGSSSEG
jgi:hypothetical protein